MSWAIEKVAYLSKLGNEHQERRIKDLYKIVKRPEFLKYAFDQIRNNKGSKTVGVDGVTSKKLSETDIHNMIMQLTKELEDQSYTPLPVRKVDIPKGFGKKGTRPLGIPALKDRTLQSAVKIILECLYEPIFSNVSHGFRPKRSCQTAVNDIIFRKFDWVIEGDIKGCFDNIKHGKLLNILRKKISDEKFINLINKFLKSGYQLGFGVDGKNPMFETKNGTPQGGIVSPILANIYLNEFDKFMVPKIQTLQSKEKKSVKKSREYSYLQTKIAHLEKAIKNNHFPCNIRLSNENLEKQKELQTMFDSKEEMEVEIEKLLEIRKSFKSNTKEYKNITGPIQRLKKSIKTGNIPFSITINYNGKTYQGETVELKTRKEAVEMARQFRKQMKHVDVNEKEEYYKNKSFGYVRYADDFVILLGNYQKEDAIQMKKEITEWFEQKLELNLSQEKTKITHSTKGFTFLGYDILHIPTKKEGKTIGYGNFAKIYVPQQKISSVKSKLEKIIKSHHNASFADMIIALNRVIVGWSNYFKIANNWNTVAGNIDNWLYWKVLHSLARKHKSSIPKMIEKFIRDNVNAFGNTRQRFVDEVKGKTIPMRKCKDCNYEKPSEITKRIKGEEINEKWLYCDIDEQEVKKLIAMKNNGYSRSDIIELKETQGDCCSECGTTGKELIVHHTRMVKRNKRKYKSIYESSTKLPKRLLCEECHKKVHPNNKITIG